MSLLIKICGLSTEDTIETACQAGADLVGFVFYARSPRAVSLSRAADLAHHVSRPTRLVGLFVDEEEATILRALDRVPLDFLQLHGDETPERCDALARLTGRKIIKALGVRDAADIARAERWIDAVDYLLFDAKPPKAAGALPGGNGVSFDWRLLAGRAWPCPVLLSGGLTASNLREAVLLVRPEGVDVSSGVEHSPGLKDKALIKEFVETARSLR